MSWSALLLATLSPEMAVADRISPRVEQWVLNIALALVVAVGIRIVGEVTKDRLDLLRKADAIEIVLGQGAKPGGGGMLLGQKISERVAGMRTLPQGIDQRSACRHPDWTGPDDLAIKINELREITDWEKPIYVKVGATRTYYDVKLAVHSGADVVVVDGLRVASVATTLLDVAADGDTSTVDTALLTQRVTITELDDAVRRYPRRRGAPEARRLFDALRSGARSEAERAATALFDAHGITGWTANTEVLGYLLDFVFRDARLMVEIDGFLPGWGIKSMLATDIEVLP